MLSKSYLRTKIINNLSYLDFKHRKEQNDYLISKFLSLDIFKDSNSFGITISKFPEFSTHSLIHLLWKQNKRIFCPVILKHHQMVFVKIDNDSIFIKNNFGIYEPRINDNSDINNVLDVIIVPGLVYSLSNNQRIGFGGGYYDRFLSKYNIKKTISLCFPTQVYKNCIWNTNKTDIKIDQIITI